MAQPEINIVNTSITQCFTKASNIFIDSYIYPLLLVENEVKEIQLSWVNKHNKVIPVVVNINVNEEGLSFWSLYECTNRDKLNDELIKAKELLEIQSKELYQLAITDSLTGLINRRELENQANRLISQTYRNQSRFALLALDVDFFKKVNDNYGHIIGDKVLKHLAELLKEERRANDIVARIGGEEFVLLLPDISEESAYKLAENLRKRVESTQVDNVKFTISLGVVVSQKSEKADFSTLLKMSDDALYNSKKSGRNKTTVESF